MNKLTYAREGRRDARTLFGGGARRARAQAATRPDLQPGGHDRDVAGGDRRARRDGHEGAPNREQRDGERHFTIISGGFLMSRTYYGGRGSRLS